MSVTAKTLLLGINKFSVKVKQVGLQKTLSLVMNKFNSLVASETVISEQEPLCEEVVQQGLTDTYKIVTEALKFHNNSSVNKLDPLKHTMLLLPVVYVSSECQ